MTGLNNLESLQNGSMILWLELYFHGFLEFALLNLNELTEIV